MYRLGRRGAIAGGMRPVASHSNRSLSVLLFGTEGNHSRELWCPNAQDSIYLGQAYEKVLFPEDYPHDPEQSLEDFSSRVQEVVQRCDKVEMDKWDYQMGYRVDRDPDALVLDPSEDVDESNWREQGHFRRVARTTDERPASTAAFEETVKK